MKEFRQGQASEKDTGSSSHLLVNPPAEPPVEEAAGLPPDGALGAALSLHASDAVVEISVEVGNAGVRRREELLALGELLAGLGPVLSRERGVLGRLLELRVLGIKAVHHSGDLVLAELDGDNGVGLCGWGTREGGHEDQRLLRLRDRR